MLARPREVFLQGEEAVVFALLKLSKQLCRSAIAISCPPLNRVRSQPIKSPQQKTVEPPNAKLGHESTIRVMPKGSIKNSILLHHVLRVLAS